MRRYSFPLFVPAIRPDRFAKAAGAGTDTIIIDLEDGVDASGKDEARAGVEAALPAVDGVSVWLRVNGGETPWHAADMKIASSARLAGVMVPKAESAGQLQSIRARLRPDQKLVALVETAKGVHAAHEIAAASDRLAFGAIDFSLEMNCRPTRDACLLARSTIVLASKIAGLPAPLDSVTTQTGDNSLVRDDALHASDLGFGGKLLIHPAQIKPAREGFAPSDTELEWAQGVVSGASNGEARSVSGEMVDLPVLERARGILERKGELK